MDANWKRREKGEERRRKTGKKCRRMQTGRGGRRMEEGEERQKKSVEGCRLEEEEKGYDSQQYCLEVADRTDSCAVVGKMTTFDL
jgi:hypothetical protein